MNVQVPSLRADSLGKRYGKLWALRECSLSLPRGGVVALVGPNGAGKSALLRLVVGLIAPTEGTIEVFGDSPAANTRQSLSRVGFLAQDHPLYQRFTVADLLHMGRSCNVRFDSELAVRRLTTLGIALDRTAGRLSGGQQAQVALAMALAKRPQLLVLDEPLASLDPLARREFLQVLMAAVAAEGVTVLFSSHVITDLERVCDHLVLLNHGRVALADEIDTILDTHRLLTGPRDAMPPETGDVIETVDSDRHTTVLVRGDGPWGPQWRPQQVDLEGIVLAYLRRRASHTATTTIGSQVPA